MKKLFSDFTLFSLSFIIVIFGYASVGVFSFIDVPHVLAQTPCYVYNATSPYYSPNAQTTLMSLGDGQSIKIPNQNPPSILQNMVFPALNLSCAMIYDVSAYDKITYKFVTPSGLINSVGPLEVISYTQDPLTSLSYMIYRGISDIGGTGQAKINNEDAIINSIDSTKKFTIRIGNTSNPGTTDMSVPATNCAKISGDGPLKIVFMRGKSLNYSLSDFMESANSYLTTFKVIDPYKKYQNQFSFYADLKTYDDSTFTSKESIMAAIGNVSSSCTNSTPEKDVLLINKPGLPAAWTVQLGKTVFMNYAFLGFHNFNITLIHELGHAIGGLNDEYLNPGQTTGNLSSDVSYPGMNFTRLSTNCTTNWQSDFRDKNGYFYGSYKNIGCSYLKNLDTRNSLTYYRPSYESIMNQLKEGNPVVTGDDNSKFNVISCGYLIAGILGQTVNKDNAASHWQECVSLDTVKNGIPPRTAAAVVNGVIPISGTTGIRNFKASGSGFTPQGNSIKLIPIKPSGLAPSHSWFALFIPQVAQAQTVPISYEINDIPSSDGTTLNFSVPTTVPDGTYQVSVGALNSPWTDTTYKIVVTGNGSGSSSTGTDTGTGTITNPNQTERIASYLCPSGYTLSSDKTSCVKPEVTTNTPASTVNATISNYTCNNSRDTLTTQSQWVCKSGDVVTGGYTPTSKCANGLGPTLETVQMCKIYQTLNYYQANVVFTCPVGGTLKPFTNRYGEFHLCDIPAVNVVTPSSIKIPTVTYSCPDGYTLSGMTCLSNNPITTIVEPPPTQTTVTQTPSPTSPTVSLSVSPTEITNGNTAKLSWTATNAYTCTANLIGRVWTRTTTENNSVTFVIKPVNNGTSPITATYNLTCADITGTKSVNASVALKVNPTQIVVSPPTATLTIEGKKNHIYTVGQTTHYKWSSTNADTFRSDFTSNDPVKCSQGAWRTNQAGAKGTTGSIISSSWAGCVWTVTYTAKNSKTGKSASDTVTVTVAPPRTVVLPTSCKISVTNCPTHTEYSNKTFNDTYENSANNQARCLLRADDWVAYCGDNSTVVAEYYTGTILSGTKAKTSAIIEPTPSVAVPTPTVPAVAPVPQPAMGISSPPPVVSTPPPPPPPVVVPAPTATLTVEGQKSYTYNVTQTTHYTWSSTNADTFSSSFSFPPSNLACSSGAWTISTAEGTKSNTITSDLADCVWTITYTAKNSTTGQSASDAVTVTVANSTTGGTTEGGRNMTSNVLDAFDEVYNFFRNLFR